MDKPTVLILLATYNGERFIGQQMESLLTQSFESFHILVSDDGSTDHTKDILAEYAKAYPDKITRYSAGKRFGNAQEHFLHLLCHFHDAPYIMLCDQDDVWHKNKIKKTLEAMKAVEKNAQIPALVHTDLRVVDEQGREMAPSFCARTAIDGNRLQLNQLLVQNVVTGCTVMINRALASLASRKIDTSAVLMHDWWLALLASCWGQTGFLPEGTIDYRQHGRNTVGAKDVHAPEYLLDRLLRRKMRQSLAAAADQAEAFLQSYSDLLTQEQIQLLQAFASSKNLCLWKRNRIYWQYRLQKKGFFRVCSQFLGF